MRIVFHSDKKMILTEDISSTVYMEDDLIVWYLHVLTDLIMKAAGPAQK